MPEAAPEALRVKEEPEDAFKVVLALLLSTAFTAPVELRARVEALRELRPANEMPAVPAVMLVVAEFSAPAAVTPEAAPEAFNVNEEPDEAFSVTLALLVSTMLTAPVELAVRVEAEVEPAPFIVMPPVPEETVSDGVVRVEVLETEPAPPGVAVSDIDVGAVSAAVSVTLPAVELRAMLLAVILAPMLAVFIVLLAVMLT